MKAGKAIDDKTGELRMFRNGCETAAEKCGVAAMSHDRAARERRETRPSARRVAAICACALLVPPFVALALVPMALILLPVAFVVIPFMIPAFFAGANANGIESNDIASWRSAVLVPLTARSA